MSESPHQLEQRISRRSDVTRRIDDSIHRRRAAFYLRHLQPHVPRGSRLLDVGAGDGLLAAQLAQATDAASVAGYDIEARSLGDFQVQVYDGRRLPVADGAADVTICVAVLHHCDDADQVLREIRRATTKRFLLVEDRFDSWLDRRRVIGFHHYLRWVESMPFDKGGFRSTDQWRRRLADAGLRVTAVHTIGRAIWWFPIVNSLFIAEPV